MTRKQQVTVALRLAAALPFSLAACGGKAIETGRDVPNDSDAAATADAATPVDAAADAFVPPGGPAACQPSQATCGVCCDLQLTLANGPACQAWLGAAPTPDMCAEVCLPFATANCGGSQWSSCFVFQNTTTDWSLTCSPNYCNNCVTGRRPEGLTPSHVGASSAVGGALAEMAWLEAASVPAFRRLAHELEAHGAPSWLCEAARRAARDEVRHARTVTALAERAGARVPPARVAARAIRSLEAIATENAVEGCVRETFGAALATVQARRARDERVRAALSGIARDEARHAQLAWAIADWIDARLDVGARQRVRRARQGARAELLRQASVEPHAGVARALGLPNAAEACAMALSLEASLA
jgi:hypothetical protein